MDTEDQVNEEQTSRGDRASSLSPTQERCAHETVSEYHTAGRFAPVAKYWSCDECGLPFVPERSAPEGSPFTKEQHHELCIGVMAGCYPFVDDIQKQAIREGIESARLLGIPVDCRNLEKGGPLFAGG